MSRRQRDEDQHGKSWIERLVEHNREFYETCITGEVFKRSKAMTATDPRDDTELLNQGRTYITLRNELLERGAVLAKALDARKAGGRTLIMAVDDEFYELAKTYSPTSGELPVRVTPVELIGR